MTAMKKILQFFKKELMLTLALAAALASLLITKPDMSLIRNIDWRTLGTLFMMLTVLEGFKKENIFSPVIRFSTRFRSMTGLSLFLVFGVFFTSMFVTNDVSLIIFVPLTILLFRSAGKEYLILPVISLQNIAAIRGSLLMPFGSPQNLFLFGRFGVNAGTFVLHMLPLCVSSALLLIIFILVMMRKEKENLSFAGTEVAPSDPGETDRRRRTRRIAYPILFLIILTVIVTRTTLWPYAVALILVSMLVLDASILRRTDYVLLATFLCFFIFSSSITGNKGISEFLSRLV